MSKAAKPLTTVERWFPKKRYVLLIAATKKCQLTYHQRLVYSYLVYRLRKDQTATKAKIVRSLRLDKQTVSRAITKLGDFGLVAHETGQYRAKEPSGGQKEWFASNGRTDVLWHRQFATYPVLRPRKSSGLSTKSNALLWLLYSLASKFGKPTVLCQNLAGLAVLLNMTKKGIKQAIARLSKEGLVEQIGTTFLLREPPQQVLELWETRPIPPTAPFRPVQLKLPDDQTDPDYEARLDDVKTINEMLNRHCRMMLKADCPERDINEYWRYIINHVRDRTELWEYTVCDFEGAFNRYSQEHRTNGYKGSPMKLLWLKIRERFPEHGGSTC